MSPRAKHSVGSRGKAPGARGFSQPLASGLLAASKRTVVLSSRCDLVTEALASLLSGFIEVLSRLTTRNRLEKGRTLLKVRGCDSKTAARSTSVSHTLTETFIFRTKVV